MKNPLVFSSMLLLAPAVTQAQPIVQAPPPDLMPATPRSITPALDDFAGVGRKLQLQTRWVQVDSDILPTAFPNWDAVGASSHVATRDELRALEILRSTGAALVTEQQINATNNQISKFSFSPFVVLSMSSSFELPEPGPIDDMIIPHDRSRFEQSQPYIPNLAKPESKLPEMAPMPGIGGKPNLPLSAPLPPSNTYITPQSSTFMDYKFQLRPNFIGEDIALELRDSNQTNGAPLKATAKMGETIVFSVPNVLTALGSGKSRRTFLLVTPKSLAPRSALEIPALPRP